MSEGKKSPLDKLVDKIRESRDFAISLVIHLIFVMVFGGTVLFQAVQEPPDFEGGSDGGGFVGAEQQSAAPPQQQQMMPQTQDITVTATPVNTQVNAITTTAVSPMNFNMAQMVMAPPSPTKSAATAMSAPKPAGGSMGSGINSADARAISDFTGGWGNGTGSGTGSRVKQFAFTAYIGKYEGGNWDSTVQRVGNEQTNPELKDPAIFNRGSLPNLLGYMSKLPGKKFTTNYDKVKAIKLDSPELFTLKPPFIFLTGTKDFKLTEAEVQNLRRYVRVGGAIWGDSSVPGRNSRFDIAFRREMRRVIPDKNKDWEELPANHEIFDQRTVLLKGVESVPPGLNSHREPVYVLRIYGDGTKSNPGQVAIIYTANDYGDMWQIGLDEQGQIMSDMAKGHMNQQGQWVAMNPQIWDNRDVYLRNINQPALEKTYIFGTNLIVHLLTRWDTLSKRSAGSSL